MLRSPYGMSCRSVVCLSSVTLLHPTHRLELFGSIVAPPNCLGTRTVCAEILEKVIRLLSDRAS